jgi:hypothetical protein
VGRQGRDHDGHRHSPATRRARSWVVRMYSAVPCAGTMGAER